MRSSDESDTARGSAVCGATMPMLLPISSSTWPSGSVGGEAECAEFMDMDDDEVEDDGIDAGRGDDVPDGSDAGDALSERADDAVPTTRGDAIAADEGDSDAAAAEAAVDATERGVATSSVLDGIEMRREASELGDEAAVVGVGPDARFLRRKGGANFICREPRVNEAYYINKER